MEVSHVPTAALLRSLQWVSWYRSRFAEPAAVIRNLVPSAHTQSARVRGSVATNVLLSVGAWLWRLAIVTHPLTISYNELYGVLLWVGAWLRRDAIASYVCNGCL